jgi:hypothetical protein
MTQENITAFVLICDASDDLKRQHFLMTTAILKKRGFKNWSQTTVRPTLLTRKTTRNNKKGNATQHNNRAEKIGGA